MTWAGEAARTSEHALDHARRADGLTPPSYRLEDLAVGDENRAALQAAATVAAHPGVAYNPLFLYGPTAVGKSHLLYGLARALGRADPEAKIIAGPAAEFAEHCDYAWQQRATGDFRRKLWRASALFLDDVHVLAQRAAAFEELLYAFDRMVEAGKQIVLASRFPPGDLRQAPAALRNRFVSGLVSELAPPRPTLRRRILEENAKRYRLRLSDSAAGLLVAEIRDLRELDGCVRRLDAETPGRRRCGRKVTVARVRKLLDEFEAEPLTVGDVAAKVCEYYDAPLGKVRSATRVQEIVQVRQLAMYLARTLTDAALVEIGEFFGGRDHSTVLHSCERAEELLAADARFGRAARDIRRMLRDGEV